MAIGIDPDGHVNVSTYSRLRQIKPVEVHNL